MKILRFIQPVFVVVVAIAVAAVLFRFSREPAEKAKVQEFSTPAKEYRSVPFRLESHQPELVSRGIVEAQNQSRISTRIDGMIESIAGNLECGNFFSQGDVLLQFVATDYRAEIARVESERAEAILAFEEEQVKANQSVQEWKRVHSGEPPAYVRKVPHLDAALAKIRSAEARLVQARENLEATIVRAPYDGMVLERNCDLGEFFKTGETLLQYVDSSTLKVRFPVPRDKAADIEFDTRNELVVTSPGAKKSWSGKLVRHEPIIDPKTNDRCVVVEIAKPSLASPGQALPIGALVETRLPLTKLTNVVKVPRESIREDNSLLCLDPGRNPVSVPIRVVSNSPGSAQVWIHVPGSCRHFQRVVTNREGGSEGQLRYTFYSR